MNSEGNLPAPPVSGCNDACGALPECAPLAVPYVPFQQEGSRRYTPADALNNGTLFPGLDLPFFLKPEAKNVVDSDLAQLQALEFVLEELALYLDTHQEDEEAFALYKQYVSLEKEGRKAYEAKHGPLFRSSASEQAGWGSWLKEPWPWNYNKEGGK